MAGITLQQAQEQLNVWLEANKAVSTGQSYTISSANGGRTLTRANAKEILGQIEYWDNKVKSLQGVQNRKARNKIFRVVPRDV